MRGKVAGGERISPPKVTFAEVAERCSSRSANLLPWTRSTTVTAPIGSLLPRFSSVKIAHISVDYMAKLVVERETSRTSCRRRPTTTCFRSAGRCTLPSAAGSPERDSVCAHET